MEFTKNGVLIGFLCMWVFIVALGIFVFYTDSIPLPASLIIYNTNINKEAIVIRNNKIVYVGNSYKKFEGNVTKKINAKGERVIPGLFGVVFSKEIEDLNVYDLKRFIDKKIQQGYLYLQFIDVNEDQMYRINSSSQNVISFMFPNETTQNLLNASIINISLNENVHIGPAVLYSDQDNYESMFYRFSLSNNRIATILKTSIDDVEHTLSKTRILSDVEKPLLFSDINSNDFITYTDDKEQITQSNVFYQNDSKFSICNLRNKTLNASIANDFEENAGSIEANKLANLIILKQNKETFNIDKIISNGNILHF